MSQAPVVSLSTVNNCARSVPALLHRVQELSLEEKQLQLDQELRGYMNRSGTQDVGRRTSRGWGLCGPRDLGY